MIFTFDSSQVGAPVLSGSAGALRAVIKACLVDGFGAGPVASITVAAGVATVAFSGSHPYRVGSVIQIAGATPSALNGNKRTSTVVGSSITFPAPGVPDGAATGTITAKMAPAGWVELFPGALANVLAVKPSAAEASGSVLRLDDTGTTTARVVGYEFLSAISTGAGAFPTGPQFPGGLYWPKSNEASTAARPWWVFADERSFMIWTAPHASYQTHGTLFGFGDVVSDKSGDAYCGALFGGDSSVSSTWVSVVGCIGLASNSDTPQHAYIARLHSGLGVAQLIKKGGPYNTVSAYSGTDSYGSAYGFPYPNGADNSLRLGPVGVFVGASGIRGRVAGAFHTPQAVGEGFSTGGIVDGQGDYAGRSFVALRVGPPGSAPSAAGTVFVDTTGPWR